MNKKGFTLIELLAVIVILALIALIATPIVTNIINSSKEKTVEASVRNYVRAVENNLLVRDMEDNTVANGTYEIMSNGNICLSGTVTACTNIFKIDVDNTHPTSGTITIQDNNVISLNDVKFNDVYIAMDNSGNVTIVEKETSGESSATTMCTLTSDSTIKGTDPGAKYTCKVSETESHNFYVLGTSTDGNSVNLLMSNNLADDVSFMTAAVMGTDDNWDIDENTEGYTFMDQAYAINQVESLTSTWDKLTNYNESYTVGNEDYPYTITLSGKARLPKYDEIAALCPSIGGTYDEWSGETQPYKYGCPSWVKNTSYWTMNFVFSSHPVVWAVNSEYETLDDYNLYGNASGVPVVFGIRPVITVNASDLG